MGLISIKPCPIHLFILNDFCHCALCFIDDYKSLIDIPFLLFSYGFFSIIGDIQKVLNVFLAFCGMWSPYNHFL